MREKRNRIFGQGAKIFIITITGCVALGAVVGGVAYLFRQSEMETRASEDLRAIAPRYKKDLANPGDSMDSNSNSAPTAYQTKEDKIGWSGREDENEKVPEDLPEVYNRNLKPHEVGAQSVSGGQSSNSNEKASAQ